MTIRDLATRLDQSLAPDPRRVIIKLFVPGEDAALARSRASGLIERITLLGHDETAALLEETLRGSATGTATSRRPSCTTTTWSATGFRAISTCDRRPVSWSAPTSATSTRWRAPRCAIPRWSPTPTSPA